MERRSLSKPQVGGLSRAQHTALQARKKRIEETKRRHNAERNAELLAKARVEFKAEPIKPPATTFRKPSQHNPNSFIFTSGGRQSREKIGFEIKTPGRLVRALQVRTTADPIWGNIKSVVVNSYTAQDQIDKIDRELSAQMMGWINNGYFGPDASFQIKTVPAPGSRATY